MSGTAYASEQPVSEISTFEADKNFIRQVIDLRRKKGLSQRQLAKLVGTHQPSISRLEAGRISSLSFLLKVAKALDASVEINFVPRQATSTRAARSRS